MALQTEDIQVPGASASTRQGYATFRERAKAEMGNEWGRLFEDGATRLSKNEIAHLSDFGFRPQEIGSIEQALRQPLQPWDAIKESDDFVNMSRTEQTQKAYEYLRDAWASMPAAWKEDPAKVAKYDAFFDTFEKTEIRRLQREDWQIPQQFAAAWDREKQKRHFGRIDDLERERVELERHLEQGLPPSGKRQLQSKEERELEVVSRLAEIKAEQMDLAQLATRLREKIESADVNKGYQLFQQTGKFSEFAKYADRQDWWGMFVGMGIDSSFGALETIAGAGVGAGAGASVGGLPGGIVGAAAGVGIASYDVEFSHRFSSEFFHHLDTSSPGWMESEDRDDLVLDLVADRAMMDKFRRTAQRGATAVATTEAATSMVTAGLAYSIFKYAGSGKRRFAHGASLVANQAGSAAGGSIGEFRALLAEGKDPFTGRALAEIAMEGLLEIGSAPVETLTVANTMRKEASLARREKIKLDAQKAERVKGVTEEVLRDAGVPVEAAQKVMAEPDLAKRYDLMAEEVSAAREASIETDTARITDPLEGGDTYTVTYPDGTSAEFADVDQAEQAALKWEAENAQGDQSRLGEIRREKQIAQETRDMAEELQRRLDGRGVEAETRIKDTYTTLQDRIEERVEAGMDRDAATAEAVQQMRGEFVDELVRRGVPQDEAQRTVDQAIDGAAAAEHKVFGRNTTEVEGNITRALVEISLGASPVEVGHEAAEVYIKEAWKREVHTVDEVLGWVNQWRTYQGEAELDVSSMSEAQKEDAAREGFAGLYEAYLAGEFNNMNLPQSVVQFFKNLAAYMHEIYRRALGLQKAFEEGAIDPRAKEALAAVMGTDTQTLDQIASTRTGEQLEAPVNSTLASQSGMESIADEAKQAGAPDNPESESYALGIDWSSRSAQAVLRSRIETLRSRIAAQVSTQSEVESELVELAERAQEGVDVALAELRARLYRLNQDMAIRSVDAIEDQSAKDALVRDIQELETIARALPPSIRGRLRGFSRLAKIKGVEARRNFLHDQLRRADDLLEEWARTNGREQVDAAVEKARQRLEAKRDRADRLRDVRELEEITALLPAEIRGKLGGFARLAQINNPETRAYFLLDRLDRASALMESWMRKNGMKRVDAIVAKARAKIDKKTRKGEGKLGGRGHDLFKLAESAIEMTPEEVEQKLEGLLAEIESADGIERANKTEEWVIVSTVGALRERPAADVTEAIPFLQDLFDNYRTRRRILDEARAEQLQAGREELMEATGKPFPSENEVAASDRAPSRLQTAEAFVAELLDVAQLLEALFPGSQVAIDLGQRLKDAANAHADRMIEHQQAFENEVRSVYQVKGQRAMNHVLVELLEVQEDTGIEMADHSETETVPLTTAAKLHNGTLSAQDLGMSQRKAEAIKAAYADHLREGEELRAESAQKLRKAKVDLDVAKRIHEGEAIGEYSEQERAAISDAYVKRERSIAELEAKNTPEGRKAAGIIKNTKVHVDVLSSKPTAAEAAYHRRTQLQVFIPGEATVQHMSQFEALQYLALLDQPEYAERAEQMGFTPKTREQLESFITPEAMRLFSFMRENLAAMWPRLNAVHERINGVNMARKPRYWMGVFQNAKEDATAMDPFAADHQMRGLSADFTRNRIKHSATPKRVSAFHTYFAHLEEAEYYIAFAEVARDMRSLLGNTKVQRSVKARHGAAKNRKIQDWIKLVEGGGHVMGQIRLSDDKIASKIAKNIAATSLAFNPKTIFINVSNSLAALQEVSSKDFFTSLARVGANPALMMKRWRAMWDSAVIQRRLNMGGSPELAMLMRSDPRRADMLGGLPAIGFQLINTSDAAFLSFSLAMAYDAKIRNIMAENPNISIEQAEAQALREVEILSGKVQQPVTFVEKSLQENVMNPVAKLFVGMFISDPRRKSSNIIMDVVRSRAGTVTGAKAASQLARRTALLFIMMPVLEWSARAVAAMVFQNKDPEDAFDRRDLHARIMSGPIGGIPWAGQLTEFMIRAGLGAPTFSTNPVHELGKSTLNLLTSPGDIFADVKAGDFEAILDDVSKSLRAAGSFYGPLGAVGNLLTNTAGAAMNLFDGDVFTDLVSAPGAAFDAAWLFGQEDAILRAAESVESDTNITRRVEQAEIENLFKKAKRMGEAKREEFLSELDRGTRRKIEDKLERDSLSDADKALLSSRLGVENGARAEAIVRALRRLPEEEHAKWIQHWQEVGVITPTVRRQLRDLGVTIR